MSSSVGVTIPNWMEKKKLLNHQPVSQYPLFISSIPHFVGFHHPPPALQISWLVNHHRVERVMANWTQSKIDGYPDPKSTGESSCSILPGLVNIQKANLKMPSRNSGFTHWKSMVIFHSDVSLPEGKTWICYLGSPKNQEYSRWWFNIKQSRLFPMMIQ